MANIVLSDGKNVEISTVLLNKDQNINVSKTYVTTVKKAVTKVSEDFYKVEEAKKNESTSSQVFESIKDDVLAAPTVDAEPAVKPESVMVETPETVIPELPQIEPIIPTAPVPSATEEIPTVINNDAVDSSKVENAKEILPVNNVVESKAMPAAPTTVASEPILPVTNVIEPEIKSEPIQPVVSAPVVESILPVQSEEKVEAIASSAPNLPVEQTTKQDSQEPKLFFDGSKETNLNMALGEVSEEKTMTTESEGVQALRQFGSDEPVAPPQEVIPVQENVKTLTRSRGFANNKFFMVIAIAFFVAACVFLGYEAFQYFQIKG